MPGQLLVTLSIILLSIIFLREIDEKLEIKYFYLSLYLIIFAVTTKLIYVIYFIIPILIGLRLFGIKKLFKLLLKKRFLFLSLLSAVIFIFYNFTLSGCFIYPVEKTCMFYELEWTLKKNTVLNLNLHYEAWAKGGIGTGYKFDDLQNYVTNFTWLSNWFNNYFFTKFSDFILVVLVVSFIFYLIIPKNKKFENLYLNKKFSNFVLFYFSILIVFFIWFTNFPTLRYAGYSISFFLIVVPICFFLSKYQISNEKKYFDRLKIFFVVCLVIFNVRNIDRINKKLSLFEESNFNFINFPFYWIKDVNYSRGYINDYEVSVLKSSDPCWAVKPVCVRRPNISVNKVNGYIFYYVNVE